MQTVTFNISGMSCAGCARSISNVLNALNGVQTADVSLDQHRAVVEYDAAKVGPDVLKGAIEEAGYEVAG
ncbi:MAG: heavy-metal-associated domain-containing protein [Rhodoferax sp.]|nr:heavy-metal-associated domain-containing protein [Rhodoferax sp.]